MTTQEINQIIDYGNNVIMSSIFNDLLKEHGKIKPDLEKNWQEYDGNVEILNRKPSIGTQDYKANNKLRNDYRSMIVDQGITYFIGNPVSIYLDEEYKDIPKFRDTLTFFGNNNSTDDIDLQSALYTAVCGYSGRLLYIDKKGNERLMALPPWEVIFVYDKTTDELQYAMIYYKITVVSISNKESKERTRIEWYDKKNVYYYIESENPSGEISSHFKLDLTELPNPQKHGYDGVPLIEVLNNDARKGDFDRVKDIVDAYDRIMSDSQNELEDLRNAYMVFKGLIPGEKEMAAAKLTGAFGSEDPEFSVSFLMKELTGTFHENHKKTLNENIFKFSKRVDMNDEKFSGVTQSGENRKWKMLALENDAIMKERKYTKALREMYRLLCTAWNKKGIGLDVTMIKFQFTRKLPIDLEYYANIVTQLMGKIPTKILYSLLPFIPDPEQAIIMMQEENPNNVNLDLIQTQLDEAD